MEQIITSAEIKPDATFISQLSSILSDSLHIPIEISSDYQSFHSQRIVKKRNGIQTIVGEYKDSSTFFIQLEVFSLDEDIKIELSGVLDMLSGLGERTRIILPPDTYKSGKYSLWLGLGVEAKVLSLTRLNLLISEIGRVDEFARNFQDELPVTPSYRKLTDLYKDVISVMQPVFPLQEETIEVETKVWEWADETLEFMHSNLSVAIVIDFPILENYYLAALARKLENYKSTMGKLTLSSVNAKSLTEISQKAPGIVVVPSALISIGTNLYEISNDMQNLMNHFFQNGNRFLFTGTYAEHQNTFHGGQGSVSSPLLPVIRRPPSQVNIEPVIRYAIDEIAVQSRGLTRKEKEKMVAKLLQDFKGLSYSQQLIMMPMLVRRYINLTEKFDIDAIQSDKYIGQIEGTNETFSGLGIKPSSQRSAQVQQMLTEKLTSSDLEFYLKTHLVGQDEAIEQFAAKLTEESLTRPLHQPLRLCLQGTPATGKSESTILLAQFLGVPYINIDAASIPDFYVASAQLLGSGRGIVGSHKAGRLEEAAKHHTAVVIEISDMDHANNNVRAALADLFLQVLSSGQAQAASGNMFSCANLILIFTINLPKGKDESLRKPGIGFNNFPTQKDIRSGVAKEVKSLFSSAFLSRIGNPVLYTTLQGDSLKLIAERSMKNALQSAAERLNKSVKEILVENCATESIVNALENLDSFGARLINDVARNHISQAFVRFIKKHPRKIHAKLIVTTNETGRIEILQEKKEESC